MELIDSFRTTRPSSFLLAPKGLIIDPKERRELAARAEIIDPNSCVSSGTYMLTTRTCLPFFSTAKDSDRVDMLCLGEVLANVRVPESL